MRHVYKIDEDNAFVAAIMIRFKSSVRERYPQPNASVEIEQVDVDVGAMSAGVNAKRSRVLFL